MDLELRWLRLFRTLADERHFGRTAARLHLSQPTVSVEIKRMERALGQPLFVRSSRSVELTEFGRTLLPLAVEIVQRVDHLQDIASTNAQPRRVIKIACTPSIVDDLFPRLLREVERSSDRVTVHEIESATGRVEHSLHEADLAIARFVEPPKDWCSEHLGAEPVVVLLSDRHPAAARTSVSLSKLSGLRLLIWSREQAPRYFDELIGLCRAGGLEPSLTIGPANLLGVRSYLLAEGEAFCLVPASAAHRLPVGVVARPLIPTATLPLTMMYRPTAFADADLGVVLDTVRTVARCTSSDGS